ncbi:MAG: hypothetical protein H6Q20_1633 [Bacteroidetes bacterium]|jgi:hypothetical protein|nr:hypothetical protein [Bacteroidota bacterium]
MSKSKLKTSVTLFIIFFCLFFITVKFAGGLGRHVSGPISTHEAIKEIPIIIIFSIIIVCIYNITTKKK